MKKSVLISRNSATAKAASRRLSPDGIMKALTVLFISLAITAIPAEAQISVTAKKPVTPATVTAAGQGAEPGAADAGQMPQQQHLTFGYLSYDSVLHAMPAYATAMRQLDELKAKYEAEAKRVESDFNKKYEEFLEGQRDFPQTILQKRQSELQELLDRNILFREESRRLLIEAERDLLAPLHARINSLLRTIGEERGYAFIINTDGNACPFISPLQGENIGPIAAERLR